MATLRKRRNKWYARIRTWDGQREKEKLIPLRTESKADAWIRLAEVNKYENDIKNGMDFSFPWLNENCNTKFIQYTVTKAIQDYLCFLQRNGRRKSTINRASSCMSNFMKFSGKNFPVTKISNNEIENYKTYLSKKLSDTGVNINLIRLRAFINWIIDYSDHDITIPKITMLKIPQKSISYLCEKDMAELMKLDWLDPHYKMVFRFYWETGCRLREPFNGELNGKWLIVNPSESKTGIQREIELTSDQMSLVEQLQSRLRSSTALPRTFTTKYSRVFKKACATVGKPDLYFHNLRDTFAVLRYLQVRDIYQVSKELGHTTVKVTEKYAQFRLSRLESDFPTYASGYCGTNNGDSMFRDTHFRDTSINSKVFVDEESS
ncbi:MAG: tyrosine-type recombinase/integrase [Candidatus Marinimicrobia bacterium]|nr:tyrosine-type recombinase/integrase [Candidatus Neomarinimicrobiota bacterium]